MHLLEDRSDLGEGWNWRPAEYDSVIWGENSLVQFAVEADGPLCTVWKIRQYWQSVLRMELQPSGSK